MFQNGWEEKEFIRKRVWGMEQIRAEVANWPPEEVERVTGVPGAQVKRVARLLAENRPATVIWCMGGTQHTVGNNNTRAYCILQLALGNMGVAGGGTNIFRGHDNVQGATDLGLYCSTLPGYYGLAAGAWKHWAAVWQVDYEWLVGRFASKDFMEKKGIPVSRWIDGVLEKKENVRATALPLQGAVRQRRRAGTTSPSPASSAFVEHISAHSGNFPSARRLRPYCRTRLRNRPLPGRQRRTCTCPSCRANRNCRPAETVALRTDKHKSNSRSRCTGPSNGGPPICGLIDAVDRAYGDARRLQPLRRLAGVADRPHPFIELAGDVFDQRLGAVDLNVLAQLLFVAELAGEQIGLFGYTLGAVAVMIDLGRYWQGHNILLPWLWNTNSVLLETALCIFL